VDERGVATRLRAAGCVFAEDEAALLISEARTPGELEAMVGRRAAGLPLEQVLGWAEFCGLRISVDPGVFVPRRRTGFLVRQAVALSRPGDIIVDLCCGAGAIGAALAAAVDRAEVHAADIDPAAVRCARRNVPGHVYQGDLYEPLPARLRGRVAIVVANVPYVPSDEVRLLPAEARAHEPLVALDGGSDGLDVLRRVAAGAPAWLRPGGHLLIETSQAQAPQAAQAFSASGLTTRTAHSAALNVTVIIGQNRLSERSGLRTFANHSALDGLSRPRPPSSWVMKPGFHHPLMRWNWTFTSPDGGGPAQMPGKSCRSSSRSTPLASSGGVQAGPRRP
jgi:release factor glutamine methyltransferase